MKIIRRLDVPHAATSVVASGDKQRIAASNAMTGVTWILDVNSGKQLASLEMEAGFYQENTLQWAGDYIVAIGEAGTKLYIWSAQTYALLHRLDVRPCSIKNATADTSSGRLLLALQIPAWDYLRKNRLKPEDVPNLWEVDLEEGQVLAKHTEDKEILKGSYFSGRDGRKSWATIGNMDLSPAEWGKEPGWAFVFTVGMRGRDVEMLEILHNEPANKAVMAVNNRTGTAAVMGIWPKYKKLFLRESAGVWQELDTGGQIPHGLIPFGNSFLVLLERKGSYRLADLTALGQELINFPGEVTNGIFSDGQSIILGVDNQLVFVE